MCNCWLNEQNVSEWRLNYCKVCKCWLWECEECTNVDLIGAKCVNVGLASAMWANVNWITAKCANVNLIAMCADNKLLPAKNANGDLTAANYCKCWLSKHWVYKCLLNCCLVCK